MKRNALFSSVFILLGTMSLSALATDYDGDGLDDIAFDKPGGTWSTIPIVFVDGDGTWTATNNSAPTWAHQSGVVAILKNTRL